MSENTPIEWADNSWSPWEGCQKVGPGCDHCYAESMNRWLRRGENWGPGAPRRIYSDVHWEKPLRWNAAAANEGRRPMVFPSVCDPFDNAAPEGQRARFAQLILDTPNLIWLLLTKRIGNAAAMLAEMFPNGTPENVWIGATVVNQEEANRDIPKLLATPAALRFLSIEPLLGPIDLLATGDVLCRCEGCLEMAKEHPDSPGLQRIDWVIVGGESGRGARPTHPAWIRSLRDQCEAAGTKFMFKQWGAWAPHRSTSKAILMHALCGQLPAGAYEQDGHIVPMQHFGKGVSGRDLDGVIHDAIPDVPRPMLAAAIGASTF